MYVNLNQEEIDLLSRLIARERQTARDEVIESWLSSLFQTAVKFSGPELLKLGSQRGFSEMEIQRVSQSSLNRILLHGNFETEEQEKFKARKNLRLMALQALARLKLKDSAKST